MRGETLLAMGDLCEGMGFPNGEKAPMWARELAHQLMKKGWVRVLTADQSDRTDQIGKLCDDISWKLVTESWMTFMASALVDAGWRKRCRRRS